MCISRVSGEGLVTWMCKSLISVTVCYLSVAWGGILPPGDQSCLRMPWFQLQSCTYLCFDSRDASGVCHLSLPPHFLLSQVQSAHICTSVSSSAFLLCLSLLLCHPPLIAPCGVSLQNPTFTWPWRGSGGAHPHWPTTITIATASAPHPLCQLPYPHPTHPGPLRQLRGKGHPEERAPPRRPQWQFHIMPCPSDAASSKGYTGWDVTGPLYRAGRIGSMIFFIFYVSILRVGREERRGTKVLLTPLTPH